MISTVRGVVRGIDVVAPALGAPGRATSTYGALAAHIDDVGDALRRAGIGRNDRVAIVVPNGPEMASVFLAVSAWATAAPLNPAYLAADFDFYLDDLDAALVIVSDGFDSPVRDVAAARGIPVAELAIEADSVAGHFRLDVAPGQPSTDPAAEPDDIALVLHTSGTTSRPKIVPLTHTNICTSASNIAATLGLSSADRCLNVMPLFHIHGLMAAVLASVHAGAELVCTPGFDGERFFDWLDQHRPTWYTAVPTMHQAVLAGLDANRDIVDRAELRFVRSSSASLPPPVMAALAEAFRAPVIEAYGMTEAAHQMASNPLPPREQKPGAVGPAAGPDVAIMNAAGELLAAGEVGEVVIRGANVTSGYEANPEANASAFTGGWFRTGDEGVLDADGYLRLTGRLKEMVNRGGEKVVPREIDEALLGHPAVEQAVAFAMPHATLGEDLGAAVVLADGATVDEAALRAFCFEQLAGFKVPSVIAIVAAIPKGATGKLQRIGLADKLADALAVDFAEPEGELETAVAAVWADVVGSRFGRHENFFAQGGDSIMATAITARLAPQAAVALEPADIFRAPTVAGYARLMAGNAAGDTATDDEAIIELRSGVGRPIYCVPGHGGDPFTFLEMAKRLDTDRPVRCFQFPADLRSDDRATNARADARLGELAGSMLARMRADSDGPYDLLAFCFGANIGHEMIARLEDAGEAVGSVMYIHAWLPGSMVETREGRRRRLARNPSQLVDAVRRRVLPWVEGDKPPTMPPLRRVEAPITLVKLLDERWPGYAYAEDGGWGQFARVADAIELPSSKQSVFASGQIDRRLVDAVDALYA